MRPRFSFIMCASVVYLCHYLGWRTFNYETKILSLSTGVAHLLISHVLQGGQTLRVMHFRQGRVVCRRVIQSQIDVWTESPACYLVCQYLLRFYIIRSSCTTKARTVIGGRLLPRRRRQSQASFSFEVRCTLVLRIVRGVFLAVIVETVAFVSREVSY